MLRTFDGLSMQDSYKMDLVAGGISQALVTTQAGLLIAIPAIAMIHLLNRKKEGLVAVYQPLGKLIPPPGAQSHCPMKKKKQTDWKAMNRMQSMSPR